MSISSSIPAVKDYKLIKLQKFSIKYKPIQRQKTWQGFYETKSLGIADLTHQKSEFPVELSPLNHCDTYHCLNRFLHHLDLKGELKIHLTRTLFDVFQAKDKGGAAHLFSQFCHKTRSKNGDISHKLLGKQFQVQVEHLRQLIIKGLQDEDLLQWFTADGFRSLIALVGTNGQGIGTRAAFCLIV
ncbi:UNVERIFIED_CONTAM: SET and MYND domain-containing protein 5 [Trichonephila clavipes]